MAPGDGRDWRGGKRRRETAPSEQSAPGWKQSRKPVRVQAASKSPRLKVVFPALALVVLVAFAIWMYLVPRPHYTHLLVVNPLQGAEWFSAGDAPQLTRSESGFFGTRRTLTSPLADFNLTAGLEESRKELKAAGAAAAHQSVVVYVQTIFLADPVTGSYRCLISNSDFDLTDSSSYLLLSDLKQQLQTLREENPAMGIVLLLDIPPVDSAMRLGWLAAETAEDVASWATEIERLVVVSSCASDQTSVFAGMGAGGRTAFSHFAECGFGSVADSNANNEITVSEYCRYVQDATTEWVRDHRRTAGQQVTVTPAIEELTSRERSADFVLLKGSEETDPSITGLADSDIEQRIARNRKELDALSAAGASRWNPLLRRLAFSNLSDAEVAYINGQFAVSVEHLSRVELWLKHLQQEDVVSSANAWNSARGLKREWFAELPVASRLQHAWGDSANAVEADDQVTLESILRRCLQTYPYAELQIPEPPAAQVNTAFERRQLAEQHAADAFGCAHLIRDTILAAERRLLHSEDLLFVGTPDQTAESDAETAAFLADLGRYVVEWQEAEAVLIQALELAPTLTEWAAVADVLAGADQQSAWEDLLVRNHVDTPPTRAWVDDLLTRLERIETADATSWTERARQLRGEVFRLLVHGRRLHSLVVAAEPDGGFEPAALRAQVAELQQARGDCLNSVARITELSQQLTDAVLAEDFTQRNARIGVYQRLRNILLLPTLPPTQRASVLRKIVTLDGQLAAPAESPADQKESAGTETVSAHHRGSMLWAAQVLSLDVTVAADDKEDAARNLWSLLVSSESDQALADGTLGAAVRSYWRDRRLQVGAARDADVSRVTARLVELDHLARLLPAVDAEQLSPELFNPTALADQLRLLDYDLLQVDRLVLGHWVDPSDNPPYRRTGWYARTAEVFLESAGRRLDMLEREALSARVALREQVESRRRQLAGFAGLSVGVSADESLVNLGLQNRSRDDIELTPQITGAPPAAGTASLNLLADTGNNALSRLQIEGNALPIPLAASAAPGSVTIVRTGNPLQGNCQSVLWTPQVFYRGRRLNAGTAIAVNPCAEETFTVERVGRPDTGAVSLSDSDSRPIAFVLDWSESMVRETTTEPRRVKKDVALESLQESIRRLGETKKASLRVFAHRIRYDGNQNEHIPNISYENVFRPANEAWKNLTADIDVRREVPLTPLSRLGKDKFDSVLRQMSGVDPWGMTPLVYAVTRALVEDLENGSGIVIVITDGAANDATPERVRELYKQIRNVQHATRLVIVAFDLRDAAGQPTPALQALEELFTVDGVPVAEIVDARNKDQLSEVIASSFDPKQFTLRRMQFTNDVYPPASLNEVIRDIRPGDDYVLEFGELSTDAFPMRIERGDSHRVSIDWRYPRFVFDRRGAPQQSVSAAAPAGQPENAPTMLQAITPAALSNSRMVENTRTVTVSMALMLNHNRVDLPVAQPAEIEFEYLTDNGEAYRPALIRETFTPEFGAPGYRITISDWPEILDVKVNARWKMSPTPPDLVLTWEELSQSATVETARDVGGQDNALPAASVWTTLTADGSLQVRLDPDPDLPEADTNRVRDVRVAIGRRDTFGTNARFITEEVTVKSTTTESGSLVVEFLGPFTEEDLRRLEVSFTAAVSHRANTFRTSGSLKVSRTGG